MAKKVIYTMFGIKTTKSLFSDVAKRILPFYDDETNMMHIWMIISGHCMIKRQGSARYWLKQTIISGKILSSLRFRRECGIHN